jgi:hypothetical protein
MEFCHDDDHHKNLNDQYDHHHHTEIWNVFTLIVCQNIDCSDLGCFGFSQFLQLVLG